MNDDYAKNEIDYIRRYEAAGFTDQYRIVENQLENLETKNRYAPQDVTILREHRYEGFSNPSDTSLLYVIQTKDGSKGTMLASYGADGNDSIHEFMNAIPESNITTDVMLPPDADE
ncbi:hypothetical protein [uncultured Gelidibacter sp.]|uniref:hypothetical protein n=1 Tax=uncultured Gelidibacter sp. TaxID=259318 RepID=UPI002629DF97|nr:hypothetical protein [uncultured Gelidibacter sp.]